MKLTEIRKSMNEAAVPQREVEKVTQWMERAIMFVVDPDMREKYSDGVDNFFDYLEIPLASPKDAKKYAKAADFAIGSPLGIIIAKVKEHITELKKLEAKLPEIERIIKAVESDIKKMK